MNRVPFVPDRDRLTVVLPAYNEEANLRTLAHRIRDALDGWTDHWSILVVDDGSSDRTAAVAEALSASLPLTLIRHDRNRGLGAAIETGLVAASQRGEVAVSMDADNTHDPELIPRMVERLGEDLDVVIASRFQAGAKELGVPATRRLMSRCASWLLRATTGIEGARDYSCGYRAYRSTLLAELVNRYGADRLVEERGFACMVELLLKSSLQGARIGEVPMILRYDQKAGASKIAVGNTVKRYGSVIRRFRAGFPSGGARPLADQPAARLQTGRFQSLLNRGAALFLLVIASPVLLGTWLALRFTSTGPPLLRERRIGTNRRLSRVPSNPERRQRNLGGRPFTLYRFRTTAVGTRYEQNHPEPEELKTPLGKALERTRLEHLPQLANVVAGDMTLVGPRPEYADNVVRLSDEIEGYSERLSIPPGMTGPGQLEVPAIDTHGDQQARVQHDLRYLAQRSAFTNVRLLFRTAKDVLLRRGSKH